MAGLPYMVRLVFGLRRPSVRVRGWDLAGRVEAVGRGVTGFKEAGLLSLLSDRKLVGVTARVDQKDLLVLKGLIETGKVTPVIDTVYPLSEAPEALRQLELGRVKGKSVLRV
jgi:NADPH:quinone reductase-like Zn-dependent oxidoreductase